MIGGQAEAGARPRKVIELEELRARLEEAEATLSAIRNGEVDALVVMGENGEKVYTLQSAETPYRVLVEAMNEGALTVDPAGTVLFANGCFAAMVGLALERVQGAALEALESVEGPGAIGEGLRRAAETGSDKRIVSLRREGSGGGGAVPALMSARRLPDDPSGCIGVVFTDLTTQRREEALARAEEEARQNRDIAERRAAELARSNADLERFAQIASHDLKEPLRGIANYATFLLEDEAGRMSQDGRGKVETIVRLSKRMHTLLDSLMEYARVGRTPGRLERCELGEIARAVRESLAEFLAQHGANLTVEPGLPRCSCDQVRLSQAISNLVMNGVMYNTSGAPEVVISGESCGDGAVVVRVKDNGIGIEARHHDRIFGVFTRLHAREKFGGGTGVGLSIVKAIAEQHGGKVTVNSSPGAGSVFSLHLPGTVG
ncbi:MAG: ATP-binding protein [Phycisphaerales bacterium]